MIHSNVLVSSVSRKAGGLFESVRKLGQNLFIQGVNVNVYSVYDEFTASDISAWLPLQTNLFKIWGPASFSFSPKLFASFIRSKADINHVHGLWMFPSIVNLGSHLQRKKPYVVSPHGMLDQWAIRNSAWKKRFAGLIYENRHLGKATCIRSLCAAETEAIRNYGLRLPVCQIPNGVDLVEDDCTSPPPWQGKLLKGKKILLYLGRIHPKKGLINLLKGWAKVINAEKEWHLVIAGWDQSGHVDELKSLAKNLCIESHILFTGPLFGQAKSAAYFHADGFILPSFSEGLPMVILEAWANRLPVLMTPFCNLPEGYEAGAAIKIGTNAENIAEGIRQLFLMSEKDCKAMGNSGLKLIQKQFTWSAIASEMKSVYEWVLGGGIPPQSVRIVK